MRLLTFFYINSGAISDDDICLCLTYSKSFLLRNQPKFEILNGFPYVDCQSYHLLLADFSIIKEVAIACIYSIISILKLKPSEAFNLAAYSYIKGHAIFLP